MSNIEEMEKIFDELLSSFGNKSYFRNRIIDFMSYCIDELKSQADRMARLEKAMAEMIKEDDKG